MLKKLYRILHGGTPEDSQREYLLKHGMKMGENCNVYSYNGVDAGKHG